MYNQLFSPPQPCLFKLNSFNLKHCMSMNVCPCCKSSLCVLFRLTDMKWRSVTMRHRRTPQITKWRASSHKLTSFPESFRASGGRRGGGWGGGGGEVSVASAWQGSKSQRWVQRCVPAGWLSSTGTEHGNLKTGELQMCLEVLSCCSDFCSNKEWRLNVGKKLNNKCMKHLTLR